MISPARQVAFAVLERVEQGGYASDLLLSSSLHLDTRDAGLASEIVYASLRRQAQLDYLIESIGNRAPEKLDGAVRIALRMGIYQLRHLDRVPAHAAVSESVELVKAAKKRSAAGFVNAVLRKIPKSEVEWPSRAISLSMPDWLLARWDAEFGREASSRIAEAFLLPPETYVRNPPVLPELMLESTEVEGAYRVISGPVRELRIQDVGSQSIVPLLDLRPGLTFLDLCAAPGNKTSQALESGVTGVACDIHWHRLNTVSGCPRVVLDAEQPLPFRRLFDRILIDAPCSGTGTLGRNPEIRWRLRPSDLRELHEKQVNILRQGLGQLAPDGRLVYSTCSLERVENEDVVERVQAGNGGPFEVQQVHRRTPGMDPGDGFFSAVFAPK